MIKQQTILEVKNLTVQYTNSQTAIINNLNFNILKGEILCLSGKSGKGKSTVVWALTDMLDAYNAVASGSITLHNKQLNYDLKTSQKGNRIFTWSDIALVPQASMSSFNPVYTIRKTITETLKANNCLGEKSTLQERLENLLRLVHLEPETLKAYPHELSGGMKQRVAIALAIYAIPQLLILDEATTGLDPLVEAQVLGTILELRNRFNMAILFISHNRELANNFCDRLIELP